MNSAPIRICVNCRAESLQLALKKYEVGPVGHGHCGLCGSLYCQKCLRPLLPEVHFGVEAGLKIVGDSIYCAHVDCGAGHLFMVDGFGRVVLRGTPAA